MGMLPKQPKHPDPAALRQAWDGERDRARAARAEADTGREWTHLERAHILSQPLPVAHVRTHLSMLGYGIRRRDRREITGQLMRILVAAPGSATRRYPLGNTGGANVGATTPMTMPDDLHETMVHGG
jgi:hypothetical protein